MASLTQRPTGAGPAQLRSGFLMLPELWGAVSIAAMWLAVLFTSIYGADIVSVNNSSQSTTTIPSGVLVAFFACLASVAVARRAFRKDPRPEGRPGSSATLGD